MFKVLIFLASVFNLGVGASLPFLTVSPRRTVPDYLPTSARLFVPIQIREAGLNKASEALLDSQCGGETVFHRDIVKCNDSLPNVFVVPHAAIRHNGEDCGTGKKDEYMLVVSGDKILDARTATGNGLGPLYGLLSSNARAFNAFGVLNDLDPVHVGFEYSSPRICGGVERYEKNTIYFFINVSPGGRDLNFGFAYLGVSELGMVTVRPDEQLCLYKLSRNLGPGQSPFATPTPSPSPLATQTPLPMSVYDLEDPKDLAKCFPVYKLDPDGSPIPHPSPSPSPSISTTPSPSSVGPTQQPTVTVTPSVAATVSSTSKATPSPTAGGPIQSGGATASKTPTSSVTPTPTNATGSQTPSPSPNDNSTAVCFPSTAKVNLESGHTVPIYTLRVGDKVLVEGGKYSEVFMFTHHMRKIRSRFVRIMVSSGASLALSPSHYVPVSGHLKAARAIVIGDKVTLANGTPDKVVDIKEENLWGLHNPQTLDGTIVVDGIIASTFTETVRPSTAVALLAPVKFFYSLRIWDGPFVQGFAEGYELFARMLPGGSPLW